MKKIHIIPIWGSFSILLLFVLFIIFAFATFSSEKIYKADANVEILREHDRVLEIEAVVKEKLLLDDLKGKSILELVEEKSVERKDIYIYRSESGEIFAIIPEDGRVQDLIQLKEGIIQPVAGGDATR